MSPNLHSLRKFIYFFSQSLNSVKIQSIVTVKSLAEFSAEIYAEAKPHLPKTHSWRICGACWCGCVSCAACIGMGAVLVTQRSDGAISLTFEHMREKILLFWIVTGEESILRL